MAFSCNTYSRATFSVLKLSYNGIKIHLLPLLDILTKVLFLIIMIVKLIFKKMSVMKSYAGLILNVVITPGPLQFCLWSGHFHRYLLLRHSPGIFVLLHGKLE